MKIDSLANGKSLQLRGMILSLCYRLSLGAVGYHGKPAVRFSIYYRFRKKQLYSLFAFRTKEIFVSVSKTSTQPHKISSTILKLLFDFFSSPSPSPFLYYLIFLFQDKKQTEENAQKLHLECAQYQVSLPSHFFFFALFCSYPFSKAKFNQLDSLSAGQTKMVDCVEVNFVFFLFCRFVELTFRLHLLLE